MGASYCCRLSIRNRTSESIANTFSCMPVPPSRSRGSDGILLIIKYHYLLCELPHRTNSSLQYVFLSFVLLSLAYTRANIREHNHAQHMRAHTQTHAHADKAHPRARVINEKHSSLMQKHVQIEIRSYSHAPKGALAFA